MLDFLNVLDTDDDEIKIRKYPGDEYGDAPDEHRWRAWWDNESVDGTVRGIVLRCYPVTKLTPCGAWVDPNAWTQNSNSGIVWRADHGLARWVSNDGGAALAKRTQKQSLDSIAVRHRRWSQRIVSDARYFIEASRTLEILMPERAKDVRDALNIFRANVNQYIPE